MTGLVSYLLLFSAVGIVFLFATLVLGRLVRPNTPNAEKLAIYECGEPTVGSSWVQFDMRFYVVALLFVIFDVEVAFFFPWAAVFGHTSRIAQPGTPPAERAVLTQELVSGNLAQPPAPAPADARAAHQMAVVAFFDILVFFGILLVGFAYLWKRGDLDWVRATTGAEGADRAPPPPSLVEQPAAVPWAATSGGRTGY